MVQPPPVGDVSRETSRTHAAPLAVEVPPLKTDREDREKAERTGKRARIAKATKEEHFDEALVSMLWIVLFWFVAFARPRGLRPIWELSDPEADALSGPSTRILNRYIDSLPKPVRRLVSMGKDPIELGIALFGIFQDRIEKERLYIDSLRAANPQAQPASGPGPVNHAGNGFSSPGAPAGSDSRGGISYGDGLQPPSNAANIFTPGSAYGAG